MKAVRILLHALQQVFGNLKQAIALSAVPLMVGLCVGAGLIAVARYWAKPPGIGGGGLMTALLSYVLLMAWLAVRWHRFILLDEHKHLLAPPSRAPFWRYIGALLRSIVIVVPAILAMLAALFVVSEVGSGILTIVLMVVMNLLFFGLLLILGAALAGAAVGAPSPIRTAWEKMKPAGGTLLVLSLTAFIGNEVVEAIMEATASSRWPDLAKVIAMVCYFWLSVLFSLSVLTTLWGHYVEGRPLR